MHSDFPKSSKLSLDFAFYHNMHEISHYLNVIRGEPLTGPDHRVRATFFNVGGETHTRLRRGESRLIQALIAELYQILIPNINTHVRNVFSDEACTAASTIKEYLTVRNEGSRKVKRSIEYYNPDMIPAIGYQIPYPSPAQQIRTFSFSWISVQDLVFLLYQREYHKSPS